MSYDKVEGLDSSEDSAHVGAIGLSWEVGGAVVCVPLLAATAARGDV